MYDRDKTCFSHCLSIKIPETYEARETLAVWTRFMFPHLPDVIPVHCISQHRFTTKKNDLFEQWYTCNYKLSYILREKVFDRFDPHGKSA